MIHEYNPDVDGPQSRIEVGGRRILCKGGGGGSDPYASALAQQRAAQERTAHVNTVLDSIFNPQNYGTNQLSAATTKYDPNGTYYTSSGQKWAPSFSYQQKTDEYGNPSTMTDAVGNNIPVGVTYNNGMATNPLFGNSGLQVATGSPSYSYNGNSYGNYSDLMGAMKADQFNTALGNGSLYGGVGSGGGFGDDFYNSRKQSYLDYYKPEFDRQQASARDSLMASLASRGLTASSQGAKEESDFAKSSDDAWQSIMKGAQDYVTDLRSGITGVRNTLANTGQYSTDDQIARSASDALAAYNQAPTFGPVGQLFANLTTPVAMNQVYGNQGASGASGGSVAGTVNASSPFRNKALSNVA